MKRAVPRDFPGCSVPVLSAKKPWFSQGFSHFWPSTSAPLSVESYPSRSLLASRRPCSTGSSYRLPSGSSRIALNSKRNGASRPVKNLAISRTLYHSPECLRTSAYTNSTSFGFVPTEASLTATRTPPSCLRSDFAPSELLSCRPSAMSMPAGVATVEILGPQKHFSESSRESPESSPNPRFSRENMWFCSGGGRIRTSGVRIVVVFTA